MSDNGASHSGHGRLFFSDSFDILTAFHHHIFNIIEARKKLETLPEYEQAIVKLDKAVNKEIEIFGRMLEKMDIDEACNEDEEDDSFEGHGPVSYMLRLAACIDEALSKQETLKASTSGITKFIDRLVQKLEDLVDNFPGNKA